jgi:hypothetical protein
MEQTLTSLDLQAASTLEGIGKIRSSQNDEQSLPEKEILPQGQSDLKQVLGDDWAAIRDKLEELAADPETDGRTRAAYARIDRRNYNDLISAMSKTNPGWPEWKSFREAADLWYRYRPRKNSLSPADLQAMSAIRKRVTAMPKA